ncbi:Tripartite-type tricarboxylate transporter, receptor component TctC [Variovorax sp. CF079]|uniref:Bug family tripartite tricarboxylate transporter substrate binding protein n=1 Tax=Variovorax sp. CF079 TaxID=1882774 RepID=UPI00087EAB0C|nr:tripartite tricarboxylate transporter substrate binding protein [Variovorax sp. CF079]SDE86694.1 Tripartite-type tricarboxylate transporter, receptor component TctC [Variovorax sp. CF079]
MRPHFRMNRRSAMVAIGAAVVGAPKAIRAQSPWPSRPLRIVVPFAAGNSVDVVARLLGDQLSVALKQPVVIDNRVGAAGIIGTDNVAKSPADGYSLLLGVDALMAVMPHINSKTPYDPFKDFLPVTQLTSVPFYLITPPTRPYDSLQQLIAAAKDKPGSITYASYGIGSATHIRMEYLNNLAGTTMRHIPYRTSPLPEMMGGLVEIGFEAATTTIPLVRSRKMKALATTSVKRSTVLPEVPTVSETLAGYEADGWHALFVPAGTPGEIVARLNAEAVRIMHSTEMKARLSDLGLECIGSAMQDFRRFHQSEYLKWGKIAKENDIRFE